MPIYSGYVTSSGKDWDSYGSIATALTASVTLDTSSAVIDISDAYVVLDTAGMNGTATAATLTFYALTYTRTNPSSPISNIIKLWDGSGFNVVAYSSATFTGNRFINAALTTPAQLACINASGGTQTAMKFSVGVPLPLEIIDSTNEWKVRSYDASQGSTGATRMVISYNEAVASGGNPRRRIMIIE